MYNDHPWNPKIVAVVDRWSLFGGHLCTQSSNGTKSGGRYRQVVVSSGLTVFSTRNLALAVNWSLGMGKQVFNLSHYHICSYPLKQSCENNDKSRLSQKLFCSFEICKLKVYPIKRQTNIKKFQEYFVFSVKVWVISNWKSSELVKN